MPVTVQSIFDQARLKYKDMPQATFLVYLNEVYRDAIYNWKLLVDQENISITAGTREYGMSERAVRVWSVARAESATSAIVLNQTSERELDSRFPEWRYQGNGDPTDVYIRMTSAGAKTIGLYPPPSTSTSGTYPRLELQVSKEPSSDLAIGDSMPAVVRVASPWVFGVCAKHAYLHYRDEYETLYQTYQREMALAENKMRVILADSTAAPKITPWVQAGWRPY